MAKGIYISLIQLAADEGEAHAVTVAEGIFSSLESLAEIASKDEQPFVKELLSRVDLALNSIREDKSIVLAARQREEG